MNELNNIGPGDPPTAPKGYTPLSVQQRGEWNSFLDYAGQQKGVDLDKDPQAGINLLNQYKKLNPNTTLTPNHIAAAQYEAYQIRKGDKFGNLTPEQLKYVRQGLPDTYLNKPVPDPTGRFDSATANLYYPQKGTYGNDIEGYATGKATGAPPPPAKGTIPLPNYDDPASRLNYAKTWTKTYGPLMQGRGDTPLRVNEIPQGASGTAKNMSIKTASKLGLDPALLYSSAMEEGMSGLFPNQKGEVSDNGEKGYPISGSTDFGLDQFVSEVPRYIQKGYLPKDFGNSFKQYVPKPGELGSGGKPVTTNSANFKTVEDAYLAKAAYLKDNYDTVDEYAKKTGATLSPKARDFFSLVAYNAGEGTAKKMMEDYKANGLLKDDKFTEERPTSGKGLKETSYKTVWENVARRTKMAEALKKEGLFQ
jgi:hypothetical protein